MVCNKLIKEAFEGIEFRYKLEDTLEELGNQKLSSKQLEGFLIGKGVSPKEIKQSGIFDNKVNIPIEQKDIQGISGTLEYFLNIKVSGLITNPKTTNIKPSNYITPAEFSKYKNTITKEDLAYLRVRQDRGYVNDSEIPYDSNMLNLINTIYSTDKYNINSIEDMNMIKKEFPFTKSISNSNNPVTFYEDLTEEISSMYSNAAGNKAHNNASVYIDKPLYITRTSIEDIKDDIKVSAFAVDPLNPKSYGDIEDTLIYRLPARTRVAFVDRGKESYEGTYGIAEEVIVDSSSLGKSMSIPMIDYTNGLNKLKSLYNKIDNRVMTGKEWLELSGGQRLSTTTLEGGQGGSAQFDKISLGTKGVDNESYKEVLTGIKSPSYNAPKEPHFNNQIPNLPNKEEQRLIAERNTYVDSELAKGRKYVDIIKDKTFKDNYEKTRLIQETIPEDKQSLLGWRRTHTDTINGSKVTVLNELQSDWAQTERAGRGTFESNFETNKTSDKYIINDSAYGNILDYIEENDLYNTNKKLAEKLDDAIWINDNEDPTINIKKLVDSLGVEKAKELIYKDTNIVADFPMSEVKHTQYQIVGALDEAIKNGTNKVVIPIQRENELMGSAGVTKFYESLNTKILPDIRKKLEKQGLKISVSKKPYSKEIKVLPGMLNRTDIDSVINRLYDTGVKENLIDTEIDNIFAYLSEGIDFGLPRELKNKIDDSINFLQKDFSNYSSASNELWTLTIDELPNTKVKWDVYGLIGSLGLAGYVNKEGEQ